ncbi:MAG: glucose-1-phosphate adenylyltransferase subunit GlgD [Fastidiosipilaceae bacterium]|jgi:glucose-1-phosphate adenylyltransferase
MLKNAIGLIIADDRRITIGDLSRHRALGAIPFGGRYRVIDFILSNYVNTGIYTIGVSTFMKYRSLMDHLGTGSAWDLDRKNQGLHILPPNIGVEAYNGSGDDIAGIWDFYRDFKQDYIIISSCHTIYNMTYEDLLQSHIDSKSDITVMYNNDGIDFGTPNTILDLDRRKRVKGVYQNPDKPISNRSSMDTIVMSRELFIDILGGMIAQGQRDFGIATLIYMFDDLKVSGFEYKGVALRINSLQSYFSETMRTLEDPVRKVLFYGSNPIFTKVKDEAPAYYNDSCIVDNSLISDGCTIMGLTKNSLLFRGVTLSGQSKLINCIVFQDSFISEGCELENVIIDKDAVIRPGTKLIGNANYPIVIGKGAIV